ncbi:MAG: aminotransferase class I/II-fold pyridoxal phosphate-dependent enzyme [Gemmatimonadota bacterium]
MPVPTERLQRIKPYVFATLAEKKRARLATGAAIVDLSLGSPDQPMPDAIIESLATAVHDRSRHGYPDFTGDPTFKRSFAGFLERRFGATVDPMTQLVPTAGAKEALAQVIQTYCNAGDVVLITDVAYPVYERAAMAVGAETVALPVSAAGEWWPDLGAVSADLRRRAKVLVLNFPNNPTCAVTSLDRLAEAVAFARANDILFVSDLAYSELTFRGEPAPSVLQVPGALDTAIEIHSGSKNFSMAGLRVGMVVGSPEVCRALNACRNLVGYGAPTVVQLAAATAFERAEELSSLLRAGYRERFEAAGTGFASGGFRVELPAAAMYLWLPVPAGMTDWEATELLLSREGIVLTPGSGFGTGGAEYLRMSMVAPPAVLEDAARRAASIWR